MLGAQQLLEMVWQMVSRTDDETKRFLSDVILLCTPANPDGMDLISDGYMKYGTGSGGSWKLWNHYAGHDDNRDSFMNALNETTNVSKVMYREWFPQIMYNHHQTGPNGAVMFAPPFRDPFNYNFHPEVPAAMDDDRRGHRDPHDRGRQAGRRQPQGRRTTRRGGTAGSARRRTSTTSWAS